MSLPEIRYCPGTLAEGFTTYSRTCLTKVFNGKKVSHILPYNSPSLSEEDQARFIENRARISISGVQEKLSLILDKNKLRLTNEGEHGTHILKPIPRDLKNVDQVPANEHLTMQIASQVYGITTAENALVFFENGDPAYITKRFDIKDDARLPARRKANAGEPVGRGTTKWGKEDFATLAGKTSDNADANFKYNYSYEELADLLIKYVPAYRVEIEKLYRLIVFNYLLSNGDAHLKNFSILETPNGDHMLSPAYDLINTRIHVDDTDFALTGGLFKDGFESEYMRTNGWVGLDDFCEFARRLGISESRREKLLEPFLEERPLVEKLIDHSFLNNETKMVYRQHYETRRGKLNAR